MKNIENSEAERLTKTRMFLTPFFIGFFWKKKYLYTVIDYDDGIDEHSIVFDFHRSVEKVQGTIYQKMIATRRNETEQVKSNEKHEVSTTPSLNNSLENPIENNNDDYKTCPNSNCEYKNMPQSSYCKKCGTKL